MLHNINLLPWREEAKQKHQQRFWGLLALTLICAVLVQASIGYWFDIEYNKQAASLDQLKVNVAQLNGQIKQIETVQLKKEDLLARLEVISALQQNRNKTTELMNLFQQVIPSGVYVDKIKMQGLSVTVVGISENTTQLTTLLDTLESSPQLTDIIIHSISDNAQRFNQNFQKFNLSFQLLPNEQTLVDQAGALGAGAHG